MAGAVLIQLGGGIILRILYIPVDEDSGWVLLELWFAWVGVIALGARFLSAQVAAKPLACGLVTAANISISTMPSSVKLAVNPTLRMYDGLEPPKARTAS